MKRDQCQRARLTKGPLCNALCRAIHKSLPVGEFALVVAIVGEKSRCSLNYRIDNGGCRLSQKPVSGLCSVHLENVSRDVYDDIVIHALKLEKWVIGGDLKPRYEFGGGFSPPAA